MTRSMKAAAALVLAWYVTLYGRPVAGPFTFLSDCEEIRQVMEQQNGRFYQCQVR